MAYGLKYTVSFSTLELRISQKDYVGSDSEIQAGQPAVVHAWDTDNPIAPIKGSNVTANIIGVPLLDFYADNDDEYYGELYSGSDLLFAGFLVQEDNGEPVDDLLHNVTLSFTDNLGLLKDVSFGDALDDIGSGGNSRIELMTCIRACLVATGISLPVEVFSELLEDNQSNLNSFLWQTYIAKEGFKKSDTEYKDCYTVLGELMERFFMTIQQAEGQWKIIRWFEHDPTSFKYDAFGGSDGTGTYNNFKVFGFGEDLFPEYGLFKRVLRPYKRIQETFNYKQTPDLLKNSNLTNLGTFLQTQTIGDIRYDDYELVDFTNDGANDAFIRVETDIVHDIEIQRYVYQPYAATGQSFTSNAIEVQQGDRIDLSFSYRAAADTNDDTKYRFQVRIETGTDYWVIVYTGTGDLKWYINTTVANIVYEDLTADDDIAEWRTMNLSSFDPKGVPPLPADGLLYFKFYSENDQDPNQDSFTKEFRFTYTPFISESLKITGHTHTRNQILNTKNVNDITLEIDDSPRNCLQGTLFLETFTNQLQDRTSIWNTGKRLGEITTLEMKQWRSKARTLLEGTLYGKAVADVMVSPLTTFTNPAFPDLNFIPGRMEIDYANRQVRVTLHELYATGETAVTSAYEFKYLYDQG